MSSAAETDLGLETLKGSLAKVVMAALGFVGTIIFANLLARPQFGAFYLLLAVVQLVERPVSGGLCEAAQKRASEATTDPSPYFGAIVMFGVTWVTLSVVLAKVFEEKLIAYVTIELAAPLFAAMLAAMVLFHIGIVFVNSTGRVGRAVWFDTVRSVLTLFAQVVLVVLGLSAAGMAIGFAGATVLSAGIILVSLRLHPTLPSRRHVRSLLTYARYSIPTSLLWKTFDRIDVLLLGVLAGSGAVGDYEVAMKLTIPALFVAESLGTGLMVKGSSLDSTDDRSRFGTEVTNGLSYASIISIPLFFGAVAVATPLIVTLYGREYIGAASLLVGLCLFRILSTQTVPLYKTVNGIDRPDLNLWLALLALIVNVVLALVLFDSFGPLAVVIGTVIAELVRYIGLSAIIRLELPTAQTLPRPLFEQIGAGLLMGGIVYGLQQATSPSPIATVALIVPFGGIVYGITLLTMSSRLRTTAYAILDRAGILDHLPVFISQLLSR